MPHIENVITHRPITRTTSPDVTRHPYVKGASAAPQSGPSLTLRDVRMPRRGNVDDLRSDEPSVMDSFQRAELQAIRDRQKLDKFVSRLPAPSLRPRLVRIASAPVNVPTITDAGKADARIEPERQPRQRSIYNRHGLTSRGRVVPAGIAKVEERPIPGAVVYPALPAQSVQFYRERAKS